MVGHRELRSESGRLPLWAGGLALRVLEAAVCSLQSAVYSLPSGRKGSILLYVVWMVALLSILASSVASQAEFATGFAQRSSEQLRAAYLARAAFQAALAELARDPTPAVDGWSDGWANNPAAFQDRPLGGGWFSIIAGDDQAGAHSQYGLDDEQSRINLNTAPGDLLARLLESVGGVSRKESTEIAAAIEDWRDKDDQARPLGAEGFYYRSRPQGYGCKDGPFENVEELLLVKGVSPQLYGRLSPSLTVYGSGHLNLNTARRETLAALGLTEAGVGGLVQFLAGEDGQERTADDRLLSSLAALDSDLSAWVPAEDLAHLSRLGREGFLGINSEAFRMRITAQTAHPTGRIEVVCVVDRHGTIQRWDER